MRYIILGYLFLIPLIYASKITLSNDDSNKNKTLLTSTPSSKEETKLTQVSLITEGGSISPKVTDLTLPIDKFTNLPNITSDQTKKTEHAIAARKNAVFKEAVDVHSNVTNINNDTLKNATKMTSASPTKSTLIKSMNTPTKATQAPKVNITETHKKPLFVSYEDVVQNDDMSSVKSSSNPSIPVQIPTPNSNGPNTNHPGMIMPIIITILVVPMFAILGYMALRRGQEAWKNRHYKRMDFLLDGMYND